MRPPARSAQRRLAARPCPPSSSAAAVRHRDEREAVGGRQRVERRRTRGRARSASTIARVSAAASPESGASSRTWLRARREHATRTTGSAARTACDSATRLCASAPAMPGTCALRQQRVPARERLVGRREAAEERVARVERVERGRAREPSPARRAPLAVAVAAAPAPTDPAGPSPSSGSPSRGRERMRGEGGAAERRACRRARRAASPEKRNAGSGRPRPTHVPGRRRDLGARRPRARRRGSPRTASRRGCCGR